MKAMTGLKNPILSELDVLDPDAAFQYMDSHDKKKYNIKLPS
jgi:hypothetical protein